MKLLQETGERVTHACSPCLDGLPCRVGQVGEGVIEIGYGPVTDAVRELSLTCVPSTIHTLTVTKSATDGGTVSGGAISCGTTCSTVLPGGDQVTLTATPTAGYRFAGWSGACTGTGECTVTMNSDKTVAATFIEQVTLRVVLLQQGHRTMAMVASPEPSLSPDPCTTTGSGTQRSCTATYDVGTQVTLTASTLGFSVNWLNGPCTDTNVTSCTLTLDSDIDLAVQVAG
ncbi:InlB B-repeat-containing protein [Nocardioides coralli]|uniref:InlB B-repeat-containing protein n=1 Tax=Nocardioides coralli TaxID=2872154 RepID=UPI001CA3F1C8|nr:hypothetical protein [Nocardioides coralli]QZY28831.1 hypothetical protein K6T13_15475 [Nocardioides coralli]